MFWCVEVIGLLANNKAPNGELLLKKAGASQAGLGGLGSGVDCGIGAVAAAVVLDGG